MHHGVENLTVRIPFADFVKEYYDNIKKYNYSKSNYIEGGYHGRY